VASFWKLVASDVAAKAMWCYGSARPTDLLRAVLTDGTAAMVWYRLMQWSRRWRLVPLELACNKLNAICCNCIIGRGAEFGEAFVLIHSTGIVINGKVRGGDHVYLEHQVTIGAERQQSPVLGDHVFIGAGAKVVGAIEIGSHTRIGANAVVVHDIPAGCTAVGIPAKVVRKREPPRVAASSVDDSNPSDTAACELHIRRNAPIRLLDASPADV
jgi:serine O-acetyltransferase